MKISYAVTVCNELLELQRLLPFLIENKRDIDEIVIFFDTKNGSKSVEEYLRAQSVNKVPFRWFGYHFDGHFANMKNALTEACLGKYIYQIDADEMISEYVMSLLPQVLEANDIDVVRVPRINTVEGLTQEHISRWKWHVNERGWVNFPIISGEFTEIHRKYVGKIKYMRYLAVIKLWQYFQQMKNGVYTTIKILSVKNVKMHTTLRCENLICNKPY